MKLLAQTGFLAGVLPYIELYILPKDPTFFFLTSPSPLGLQRGASIGLTIHVVAGFWITLWGLMVGSKRSVYREKARKDGEKDVDQRYGLPNLYVEGCTKHSKAFNCVQRSHQQIFEVRRMLGVIRECLPSYVFNLRLNLLYPRPPDTRPVHNSEPYRHHLLPNLSLRFRTRLVRRSRNLGQGEFILLLSPFSLPPFPPTPLPLPTARRGTPPLRAILQSVTTVRSPMVYGLVI